MRFLIPALSSFIDIMPPSTNEDKAPMSSNEDADRAPQIGCQSVEYAIDSGAHGVRARL